MSVIMDPDNAQNLTREQILERLISAYETEILRICYVYLRDWAQAEDATQETFLKAYRKLSQFRGESSEKTWLVQIALNTCRDMRRSGWFRFLERRITPEMLPAATQPYDEEEELLTLQVMNLPPKLREAVLLYYYQDMDEEEIARMLGIKRSSVSDRLRRARQRLFIDLEGRDTDEKG